MTSLRVRAGNICHFHVHLQSKTRWTDERNSNVALLGSVTILLSPQTESVQFEHHLCSN